MKKADAKMHNNTVFCGIFFPPKHFLDLLYYYVSYPFCYTLVLLFPSIPPISVARASLKESFKEAPHELLMQMVRRV